MAWKDFKMKIKREMSDILEIPSDVLMDLPKIILLGDVQVFIENHRGIVEYSSDRVRIHVKEYEVVITGENLRLKNVFTDEIQVEGKINGVQLK